MRRLFLAVLGVVAVAGVASAQQPIYQQPPIAPPAYCPGAVAAIPAPAPEPPSLRVMLSNQSHCPRAAGSRCRSTAVAAVTGNACNSGCGSVKSDRAFQPGSCKSFFAPCGPSLGGHGGLAATSAQVPDQQFAQPWAGLLPASLRHLRQPQQQCPSSVSVSGYCSESQKTRGTALLVFWLHCFTAFSDTNHQPLTLATARALLTHLFRHQRPAACPATKRGLHRGP